MRSRTPPRHATPGPRAALGAWPRVVVCLVAWALAPATAGAHDRSVSQSVASVDGRRVVVRVRSRTVDLSALSPSLATWAHGLATTDASAAFDPLPEELVTALHAHFRVVDADGAPCDAAPPLRLASPPAELRVHLAYVCASAPDRYLSAPWPVPGHHHMAHVDGTTRSVLAVGETGELSLAEGPEDAESAGDGAGLGPALLAYLRYGATHAATGWDHALFVLLLLAFASRARDAAVLVTGFTLGHALTLGLAALSVLESDTRAVESLIAASVALVAAENVGASESTRARRAAAPGLVAAGALALGALSGQRALVYFGVFAACATAWTERTSRAHPRLVFAVAFGLVHGLGFASGFDAQGPFRVGRLVAFNAGVELAQLGWLALAWPVLRALGAPDAPRRLVAVQGFSVITGAFAAYACVARALTLGI